MTTGMTIGTTAVKLPFGPADRPVIQNLGPGDLYFGSNDGVGIYTGIKLVVGAGYEFPATLSAIPAWDEVWVVASEEGTDVRIANVG